VSLMPFVACCFANQTRPLKAAGAATGCSRRREVWAEAEVQAVWCRRRVQRKREVGYVVQKVSEYAVREARGQKSQPVYKVLNA